MTDAPQGLLSKARRSIQSARLLLADDDRDSAVCRAYYAMFDAAEALLLARGLTSSTNSAVISAFGREFAKTGQLPEQYHRYLLDAQEARNISDYQVASHTTEETALQHIARAEELVAGAEGYLKPQKC